jgi:hypothetical protein
MIRRGAIRIILVACSLALPTATLYTVVNDTPAQAAGKKAKGAKTAKKGKAKVAAYKSCGTFMYWKAGKCLDARAKTK